jgi:hypothetical protein
MVCALAHNEHISLTYICIYPGNPGRVTSRVIASLQTDVGLELHIANRTLHTLAMLSDGQMSTSFS